MHDAALQIAFFGSSLLSSYWNGAATYYRGILRHLAERGYRITFYEPDAFERQRHRDIDEPPWARVVVYPADDGAGVLAALERAKKADVLVKASGVGVFDELLEREVALLRSPARQVIFWDVDAPATLDRAQARPDDPFRQLVPLYDLVLTYGGGPPVVSGYRALGARECVPIYNALDPETHFRVAPDPRFAGDLALLANRLPDRERRIDDFFLAPAALLPRRRFLLGGSGWSDKPVAPNVRCFGHVSTRDHNAWNSTPRAVLNVSRESMARYGYSPATRVFEAAGAGACLITDSWRGIELFLEPGLEVLEAENGDEVVEHLEALTEEKARRIGREAQRRILAHHTYRHRAEQVDSLLARALEGR